MLFYISPLHMSLQKTALLKYEIFAHQENKEDVKLSGICKSEEKRKGSINKPTVI